MTAAAKPSYPIRIDGIGVFRTIAFVHFGLEKFIAQRIAQSRRHLIFQFEQVGHVFLEAVGPKIHPQLRIDKLGVDAHPVLVALHRAFEHIAHAQFRADLLGVMALPL